MDDLLDGAIAEVLVACYDDHEGHTAFLTALHEEIGCPAPATLLGIDVTVTALTLAGNRMEVIAHCRSEHGTGEVALADLRFPPDTVGAWLHAAYRRYLDLPPFPADPRPEWTRP